MITVLPKLESRTKARLGERKLGWHFIGRDRRLRHTGRPVIEGGTTSIKGTVQLCINGLHASELIIDALKYAPGPLLCLVEVSGEMQSDYDKFCGKNRRVLAILDVEPLLNRRYGSFRSAVTEAKEIVSRGEKKRREINAELVSQVMPMLLKHPRFNEFADFLQAAITVKSKAHDLIAPNAASLPVQFLTGVPKAPLGCEVSLVDWVERIACHLRSNILGSFVWLMGLPFRLAFWLGCCFLAGVLWFCLLLAGLLLDKSWPWYFLIGPIAAGLIILGWVVELTASLPIVALRQVRRLRKPA